MKQRSLGVFGRLIGLGLLASAVLSAAPSGLRVVGNVLVDNHGQPVRLRGVNCAGMEFSDDGQGHILQTVQVAVTGWKANFIRLPLSQDRWFGRAPGQNDGGASYRALVGQVVDFCSEHGVHILLDLHWSDAGQWGRYIGQHDLPDSNSVLFWKNLASSYAGNPAVLFDLYNEPSRITWDQWSRGGPITESDRKAGWSVSYQAVGLQEILDAIRSKGARNVAVAGGINWSYETDGILHGHALSDPNGDGVVYANHPYPHAFQGIARETIQQWAGRIGVLAAKYPVLVTEFGSMESRWPFPAGSNYNDERWNREMIAALDAHGWSWSAWDFHPTAWPCLISDWNYTPTPHFGVWVKQALAN